MGPFAKFLHGDDETPEVDSNPAGDSHRPDACRYDLYTSWWASAPWQSAI